MTTNGQAMLCTTCAKAVVPLTQNCAECKVRKCRHEFGMQFKKLQGRCIDCRMPNTLVLPLKE